MEILIVKLGALGDVLRTTSLLAPLRSRRRDARITWLTSTAAAPLLEGNPLVDRIVTDLRPLDRRFDLVLSLEEDQDCARLARAACLGELVGVTEALGQLCYTPSSAAYYGMSLLNDDGRGGHARADRLKAANRKTYAGLWLEILGLPKPRRAAELRPTLLLSPSDRKAARALFARHGLEAGRPVAVNPGAGARWPAKQLSVKAASALLESLHREFGRPLILLGGKEEEARNRAILERTKAPVVDAGTGHSLREFAGIIERCGLLVATDSLALHIAAAVATPVVALVGPTSPRELDAFGRGRILTPRACSCFYRPRCRFATSCLDRLPPSAVYRAARPWL